MQSFRALNAQPRRLQMEVDANGERNGDENIGEVGSKTGHGRSGSRSQRLSVGNDASDIKQRSWSSSLVVASETSTRIEAV